MPEYIARISYGKDSLKMLDVIHSRGLPLDCITTTDVWATDTISANLPLMDAFKSRMDEWIWDHYRIEVEHLCARNKDGTKRTYEQMFYHIPLRKKCGGETVAGNNPGVSRPLAPAVSGNSQAECQPTECRAASRASLELWGSNGARNSKRIGCRIQGFPAQISPWCRKIKIDKVKTPWFSGEPAATGKDRNIVEYLGIAADEPKRFGQLNDCKRAPLVEFGIDEDLCGLYCQYNDILAPTYETSCRDGCWFCHNQGVNQLRLLRRNYPDLWALLMKWDLDSHVTFKADGHTVHDFDERFRLEDEMLIDPEKPFFWRMLNENLQKRLF